MLSKINQFCDTLLPQEVSLLQTLNLIDTAIRTGIFQTFTRHIECSPLEKKLRSQKPLTIIAPDDIAYA
jgi:hypothetical protein